AAFVDKAFLTPSSSMWNPSYDELFEAGFVTGYAEDDEVAVSGLESKERESVEREFDKIPLWATLKAHEPEVYKQLISDAQSGLQQGETMAELKAKAAPLLASVYRRK